LSTAIYMRVSTDMQSVEAQRHALDQYCQQQPWADEPREYFQEDGISGKTPAFDRPAFGKIFRRCEKGEFKRIIVLRIDRLCRSVVDLHTVAKTLSGLGVDLVFATQDQITFDGGAISKYMLTQFGAAAELEADLISQRTKEGIAVRRAAGVRLGRPPREISPEVAKKWFERHQKGESWTDLAAEEGIPISTLRNYAIRHAKDETSQTVQPQQGVKK